MILMENIASEEEMFKFGFELAKRIVCPATIELIGDVGAGKTTITKGIAQGLGVEDEVTSPSFTLSKKYSFPGGNLVHYDFYRLSDPGIMCEDLAENIAEPNTVTVVEWADTVADLLPEGHKKYLIKINDDGTRTIEEL